MVIPTGAGGIEVIRTADLNGDGRPDLVAGNASRDTMTVVLAADGFFGAFVTPAGQFLDPRAQSGR